MKDGVYINGKKQDYVWSRTEEMKLYNYVTYPHDYGFHYFIKIKNEKVAKRILEIEGITLMHAGQKDLWLNKLGIVIEVRKNETFLIYKHDSNFYICKRKI